MSLRIDAGPWTGGNDPVEWLRGRFAYGPSVRSWIPDEFQSYARILHPAHLWKEDKGSVATKSVTWQEVSVWSGKSLHHASSIHDLSLRLDGTPWSEQGASLPLEGQLELPLLDRLATELAKATSTPSAVWLLVWHGYQGSGALFRREGGRGRLESIQRRFPRMPRFTRAPLDHIAEVEISPSLTASGRKYVLEHGSLGRSSNGREVNPVERPPSFWWPEDRAWFVSTDIDSSSTYVGGSAGLIGQLLDDDLLEVFAASLDDPHDAPNSIPDPQP